MEHILFFSYIFILPVAVITLIIFVSIERADNTGWVRYGLFLTVIIWELVYNMILLYYDVVISDIARGNHEVVYSIFFFINAVSCWTWTGMGRISDSIWHSHAATRVADCCIIVYVILFAFAAVYIKNRYDIAAIGAIPFFLIPTCDVIYCLQIMVRRKLKLSYDLIYRASISFALVLMYIVYMVGAYLVEKWEPYDYAQWLEFVVIMTSFVFVMKLRKSRNEETALARGTAHNGTVAGSLDVLGKRYNLTEREKEILGRIYHGMSNAEIAEELIISGSTVKTHMHNALQKMGMKNRVEAICAIRDNMDKD